jgi:hypothetical protein
MGKNEDGVDDKLKTSSPHALRPRSRLDIMPLYIVVEEGRFFHFDEELSALHDKQLEVDAEHHREKQDPSPRRIRKSWGKERMKSPSIEVVKYTSPRLRQIGFAPSPLCDNA